MILNMAGGGSVSGFPEYTYTGYSTLIDDGDGNWRIKFLTSGTLKFTKLKSNIEVFLVGGGGGGKGSYVSGDPFNGAGGGGGHTSSLGPIAPGINTAIEVLVGAGGAVDNTGRSGTSSFGAYDVKALGGYGGSGIAGGSGGSGGGGGSHYSNQGGAGGTDGGNGAQGVTVNAPGGIGQGTTTREFGKADGYLYANGGHGGSGGFVAVAKAPNTGHGGDGGRGGVDPAPASAGASGVVVIRNQRI